MKGERKEARQCFGLQINSRHRHRQIDRHTHTHTHTHTHCSEKESAADRPTYHNDAHSHLHLLLCHHDTAAFLLPFALEETCHIVAVFVGAVFARALQVEISANRCIRCK